VARPIAGVVPEHRVIAFRVAARNRRGCRRVGYRRDAADLSDIVDSHRSRVANGIRSATDFDVWRMEVR